MVAGEIDADAADLAWARRMLALALGGESGPRGVSDDLAAGGGVYPAFLSGGW